MKFFASIASDLGIESQGGNGVEIIHRGPYRFEIDHNKGTASVTK
jgi:hypothetical protein